MSLPLLVKQLHCVNFRCFTSLVITLEHPIVILSGANGCGKTSILEALYFACFGRSFRTVRQQYITRMGSSDSHGSVGVQFYNTLTDTRFLNTIFWGFNNEKRSLKINNKVTVTYKDIFSLFRVVSLTEDDISLIQDEPQGRRLFLDQLVTLTQPSYLSVIQDFQRVVTARNTIIAQPLTDPALFDVVTEQMWHYSRRIISERRAILAALHTIITPYSVYFSFLQNISFVYEARNCEDEYSTYGEWKQARGVSFFEQERRYKRGLFGAHLDDFSCFVGDKNIRFFASRGQQKILLVLYKIAQLIVMREKGYPALFVIDDFILDFDETNLAILLSFVCKLSVQLIFTSPTHNNGLVSFLREYSPLSHDIETLARDNKL